MWSGKTVSIILPTYNERDSIREAIGEFWATGVVDEIVVVNNNAAPGTSEEVAKTRAREVSEPRQGYGAAIRRGLHEATGDLLIVCEPDGTFVGRDVLKLLAYAEEFDIVYGSRTVNDFIWDGANMGLFLRWGNWTVAKLMEVLFNSTSLTDVGCTMRLLKRGAYEKLKPYFTVDGSFFGPEMMLLSIHGKLNVVQIPVNYRPRVGRSSVTGDFWKAFALGLRMIALILEHRLKRYVGWRPGDEPADVGNLSAGVAVLGQALLLILFLVMAGSHLREPYVIDEVDFPLLGQAIKHTGLPIYYRGLSSPHTVGTYHVPLYGYVLAGWLSIFGESIVAVRSFSLFCALLGWVLGLRILGQLCAALQLRFQFPALIYSLLSLTTAYYIQSAVLPDIDETMLLVSYLGAITLLLDWMRKPNWRHTLGCGVLLGVALLSKMTTTLAFFLLLPLAAWFGNRRAGVSRWFQLVTIPVVGIGLFLAAWASLSAALSLNFWYPFRFTFVSATSRTGGGDRLARIVGNAIANNRGFQWLGLGFAMSLLGGMASAVVLAVRRPSARGPLAIVLVATLIVIAAYTVITGPVFWFCKYYVVVMPLAAATVAIAIGASGVLRPKRQEVIALALVTFGCLVWMIVRERDAALLPEAPVWLGIRGRGTLFIVSVFLIASFVVLWAARREARAGLAAMLLIPFVLLSVCQNIGIAVAQAAADYATRYYYGERGMKEAAELVRSQLGANETFLAAKDVGLLAGPHHFEDAAFLPDKAKLEALLTIQRPAMLVVRKGFDYSFLIYPYAENVFKKRGYRPWREIKDFTIWRREDLGAP